MSIPMSLTETFYGYIETTTDALLVFEACKRGLLPKITRRLQEKERGYLRSGTVFVFDGRESGIKRWTDGLVWSPSRILGNFLIYRELNGREHHQLKHHHAHHAHGNGAMMDDHLPHALDQRERALVGSLTTSYRFKECGLIKKTISVVVNGSHLHLISYYNKDHVLRNLLPTPSTTPQLAHLAISPELVHRQRFRISPMADAPLNRYEPYALGKNAVSASLPSPPTQSPGLDRGYMHPWSGQRRRRSSSSSSSSLDLFEAKRMHMDTPLQRLPMMVMGDEKQLVPRSASTSALLESFPTASTLHESLPSPKIDLPAVTTHLQAMSSPLHPHIMQQQQQQQQQPSPLHHMPQQQQQEHHQQQQPPHASQMMHAPSASPVYHVHASSHAQHASVSPPPPPPALMHHQHHHHQPHHHHHHHSASPNAMPMTTAAPTTTATSPISMYLPFMNPGMDKSAFQHGPTNATHTLYTSTYH